MLKEKYLLALAVIIFVFSAAAPAAPAAAEMDITLRFSDGTEVRPLPAQEKDSYWFQAAPGTPLDQVTVIFNEESGARYSLRSGQTVSFPDAGNSLTGAAYVPLQQLDEQGSPVRTVRLYVSTSPVPVPGGEEDADQIAKLVQDTPLLDIEGSPHALSGTLAKDTVVHVTGRRKTDRGVLCRVDLNGEIVYVPEGSLSFDTSELYASLHQLFSPQDEEDRGLTVAVTAYEAGIRSGKGNNDRNLLGRTAKNMPVFVFSRVTDDDGKLLDLVYCPEMDLFGYIHESQLTFPTEEEARTMFAGSPEEEQDGEFQQAVVIQDTQLFSYPDMKSASVSALPSGKTIFVYTRIAGNGENWYLAQADELLGYIPENDLQMTEEKSPVSAGLILQREDQSLNSRYAAMLAGEILMYASPSLSAGCVSRLQKGEILTVLEDHIVSEGLSWYRVSAGGMTGYVLEDQTERLLIGSYLLGAMDQDEVKNRNE